MYCRVDPYYDIDMVNGKIYFIVNKDGIHWNAFCFNFSDKYIEFLDTRYFGFLNKNEPWVVEFIERIQHWFYDYAMSRADKQGNLCIHIAL